MLIGIYVIVPWLSDVVSLDESSDASSDVSENDASNPDGGTDVSQEDVKIEYDENGDIFTAMIFCVDSENRALDTFFIDANGKTKQFIRCYVPKTTRVTNEVGVAVPISDILGTASVESVCQLSSTMTGISTDYCLRFDKEGVKKLAKLIDDATVNADDIADKITKEPISIVNPKYADMIFMEGESKPGDYYFNLTGKINLNDTIHGKTKLEWLLEYNPHADTSVGEYNSIYSYIFNSLIDQFFKQESTLKKATAMAKLISSCETNLTADQATEHLDTIFSYDDFKRHEINYPGNWVDAVNLIRKLDRGEG